MLTLKGQERSFRLIQTSPHLPTMSEESQKNPLDSQRNDRNSNTEFMEYKAWVYFENCAPLGYYTASSG